MPSKLGLGEDVYSQKMKEPGRRIWYLLFISMPLYEALVLHIRPYEAVVVIALFFIFSGHHRRNTGGLQTLDVIVMLYVGFQLLVVAVSAREFYDAARNYRYFVLGPALIYATIRLLPFSTHILLRANLFLVVVTAAQGVYMVWLFTVLGERPHGSPHMLVPTTNTYSIYAAYAIAVLLYSRHHLKARLMRIFRLLLLPILGAGLVAGGSRAVIFPFLMMLLVVYFIWRSRFRRKILAHTIIGCLLAVVLALATAPPKIEYDADKLIDDRNSVERIISWDDYLSDGASRVQFWAYMFGKALETPWFGSGYADYNIGDAGRLGGQISSAHNVLVSHMVTGGLLSLMLILAILFTGSRLMIRFPGVPNPLDYQGKALLVCFPVFVITTLTGDLTGGKAILLFFLLGLMQQVVMNADSGDGESHSGNA